MNNKKNKVVIIGAGPAGLGLAINLYNAGEKDVIILTKGDINTHKPCAGLLPKKSYDVLKFMGIDIEKDLNYFRGQKLNLVYKETKKVEIDFNECFCYYPLEFNRYNFDNYLYKKVKDLGIEIIENINIKDVFLKEKAVVTNKAKFQYNYLVFADGINGYSSKYRKQKDNKNIAFEAVLERKDNSDDFVDLCFGVTKMGYAWMGCSKDYINFGFTDRFDKNIDYIKRLKEFTKTYGYELTAKDIKGAFYPSRINKLILNKNTFLIGDAAGITDPMTAEGIYYALQLGIYLADAIVNNDYKIYLKKSKYIVKNLKWARLVNRLFFIKKIQKLFWSKNINQSSFRVFAFNEIMLMNNYSYYQLIKCKKKYRKTGCKNGN